MPRRTTRRVREDARRHTVGPCKRSREPAARFRHVDRGYARTDRAPGSQRSFRASPTPRHQSSAARRLSSSFSMRSRPLQAEVQAVRPGLCAFGEIQEPLGVATPKLLESFLARPGVSQHPLERSRASSLTSTSTSPHEGLKPRVTRVSEKETRACARRRAVSAVHHRPRRRRGASARPRSLSNRQPVAPPRSSPVESAGVGSQSALHSESTSPSSRARRTPRRRRDDESCRHQLDRQGEAVEPPTVDLPHRGKGVVLQDDATSSDGSTKRVAAIIDAQPGSQREHVFARES